MSSKRVLLTREPEDIKRDKPLFVAKGFEVLELPLIKTEALPFELPNETFDFVVFQSQKAVRYFLLKARLEKERLVAVGKKTKELLKSLGYEAFVPKNESAEGLIEFFEKIEPCKVLIPRSREGRREFVDYLIGRGFYVVDLPVYTTGWFEYSKERLSEVFSHDPIVILASPSAVKSLFANLQKTGLFGVIKLSRVVCIGNTTKMAYDETFGGVCYVPKSPNMEEVANLVLTLG